MKGSWLLCAILACARAAHANPADQFGLGARSTSLGGAVAASSRDFSANYYNPAGLADAERTRIVLGAHVALPAARIDGRRSPLSAAPAWVGGLVAPGSVFAVPFAFGLSLRVPDGRLSHSKTVSEVEPTWLLFDTRPELLFLSTGIAVRPLPDLGVGVSVGFLAATRGGFAVRGTAVLPGLGGSSYESDLEHAIDAELVGVRYATLGVRYRLGPKWALGASYREPSAVDVDLRADLEGELDAGLLTLPVRYDVAVTAIDRFLPRLVRSGVAYRPARGWELALGVEWAEWSELESPFNRARSSVDLELPEGVMLDLPPVGQSAPPADPGFRDTWTPSFGVEWTHAVRPPFGVALRSGYRFEPAVTLERRPSLLVDTSRHALSFGMGFSRLSLYSGGPELGFDIVAAWIHFAPREVELPNADATAQPAHLDGELWSVGADASVDFP